MAKTTRVSLVVSTKTSFILDGAGSSLSSVMIGFSVLLSGDSLIPHYQRALSTSIPMTVPPLTRTSLYSELGMATLCERLYSML